MKKIILFLIILCAFPAVCQADSGQSFADKLSDIENLNAEQEAAMVYDNDQEGGIMYWQTKITYADDPSDYIGEEVEISGYVHRTEGQAQNVFSVSRLVLSCCISEAFPTGLLVMTDDYKNWQEDQWVTVKGTLAVAEYDDKEHTVIIPEEIKEIEEPEDPYIHA